MLGVGKMFEGFNRTFMELKLDIARAIAIARAKF